MTTKKDLIQEKYIQLLEKIKIHTDIMIFPSIDEFEIYEMVYYFNLYFFNYNNPFTVVQDIIKQKELNISDEIVNLIFPDIEIFLTFFHQIVRKSNVCAY